LYKKSLEIIKDFYINYSRTNGRKEFSNKTIKVIKMFHQLKQKFRCKLITQNAKVEVLKTYWNRMLFYLTKNAYEAKDEGMRNLVNSISMINSRVQEFILTYYI
jgi:hypothetical protein